jgi:hypothetical protein
MPNFDSTNGHGTQSNGNSALPPHAPAGISVPDVAPEKPAKPKKKKRERRFGEPFWPDLSEHGAPKSTCANARVAIAALGVRCRLDVFHETTDIEGGDIEHLSGAHMDHAMHLLRIAMHDRFGFDPGKDNVHDAVAQIGLQNRFDPVRDYLDGLRWDGRMRLDTFLHRYFSAEDTH